MSAPRFEGLDDGKYFEQTWQQNYVDPPLITAFRHAPCEPGAAKSRSGSELPQIHPLLAMMYWPCTPSRMFLYSSGPSALLPKLLLYVPHAFEGGVLVKYVYANGYLKHWGGANSRTDHTR